MKKYQFNFLGLKCTSKHSLERLNFANSANDMNLKKNEITIQEYN